MNIYHTEVELEDGFDVLARDGKHDRLVRGKRVNRPGGWVLFNHLRGSPIKCWHCGVVGDRWVVEKGRRDYHGQPDMNLYATCKTGVVLMTRDHIIPKSLGGRDDHRNLRPGCSDCNGDRGNEVSPEDIRFAREHPELIDAVRIARGLDSLREAIKRLTPLGKQGAAEIVRIQKPFQDMGYL